MANLKIDLQNCSDDFIAEQLRKQLAQYSKNPLRTWRWWSGFLCGAIMIASMNYGDVHLCVGSCSDSSAERPAP